MSFVQLRGLTRTFASAERAAVSQLDLEIGAGEVLSLVGPSGCGKSTTLRLVAGLDRPDGGDILIDGRSVVAAAPQDRDVAMVFQGFALYPHMKVREILAFPLRMRRMKTAERNRAVEEVAALLGLTPLLDRKPAQLSGGEQQRVAMGRAIVRRPRVFLFDEPLSNLDAALRNELRVELAKLLRELRATALYVTHDQVEAMTLGHRIAVLRAGRLEQVDAPRSVYERPSSTFVASFFGSPPMNLLSGDWDGDCLRAGSLLWTAAQLSASLSASTTVSASALLETNVRRGTLTVGFRPEAVRVLGETATDDSALACAELPIAAAESLGAETHVTLDAAPGVLRLRAAGFLDVRPGGTLKIGVPATALHLFDGDTGRAL